MSPHKTLVALCVLAALASLFIACSQQPRGERGAVAVQPSSAIAGTLQKDQPTSQATPTGTTGEAAERDPSAIKALENMSSYLRTLKAFQIHSTTTRDEVLEDGQTVEFGGVADMLVERPNHLRAEVTSDKQQRIYFDDGSTFSAWAPRVNYYAAIPAPGTLRELADTLADKYDLELPLADLFYWGDRKSTDDIRGAMDIGPSQIDGVTCEHYAFRQDAVDWQVWIQQGNYPLPRKLIITTKTDPSRPKFTSVMTWNLAPSYNNAAFTFVPSKDAKKIVMAPSASAGKLD